MPKLPAEYEQNVFINCPFDPGYREMFEALVFAVFECGLRPRCALELSDAAEVRIEKIMRIVEECRWGIHDISRIELNPKGLPRFNMPLELGIFLGARRFGAGPQKRKSCLVLDSTPYRYQEFISDIAGQDISFHRGEIERAIRAVRDWLAGTGIGIQPPPGPRHISRRLARFKSSLPAICRDTHRKVEDMTFTELADAASTWIQAELSKGR